MGEPILHLAFPVRDLEESRQFYVDLLGCKLGRVDEHWIDIWFFGMQVTLHQRPDQVIDRQHQGVRHFGVALGRDELERLATRIVATPSISHTPLVTDHAGTSKEQTKMLVYDPSGNAIELKSYVDSQQALAAT
jgi:uncharacterized protein